MSEAETLAHKLLEVCRRRSFRLTTAESCTGGMVAAAITDIAGSSDIFDRGFVTYSNEAKIELLGVRPETIAAHGAVSGETASEMASGALQHAHADIAVSITGIAGPGGGSKDKPVGLVWFGIARRGTDPVTHRQVFSDQGRTAIRRQAADFALRLLLGAARQSIEP